MFTDYTNYINGRAIKGLGPKYKVISPATNELLLEADGASADQAVEALEAAQEAFKTWSHYSINERVKWMMKLRDAFSQKKELFTDLVAKEMGKSYGEAVVDFANFITCFNFYSEEVKRVYGTSITDWDSKRSDLYHVIDKRPLGVIVGHLSWNWPIWNLGLKIAPVMASGCTCVLTPSSKSPLTAMALAEIIDEIGLPKGVINIICGKSSVIGKVLHESTIPRLITVIGSSETGRTIMKDSPTSIKHFSFELGGNAPAIVMPDADIEKTAHQLASRKLRACGQGCSSVNRVFVHESIHDQFIELMAKTFQKTPVGWGKDVPDAMGPQIDIAARDKLLELTEETIAAGAKLVWGGGVPQDLPPQLADGAFIMPALLDNVTDDMRICNMEVFGPILPVLTFTDLDDVISRANNTNYGLASYLFTHDSRVIAKVMEDLDFGEVYVNIMTRGIWLPHVGIKESGIGCDSSKWSLQEYFHLKRFTVAP